MNPLKQAKQWFKVRRDWLGEGGQPSPKAQLRTNQCLSCPWHDGNRGSRQTGCGKPYTELETQKQLAR